MSAFYDLFTSEVEAAHAYMDRQEALMLMYGYDKPALRDARRWKELGMLAHTSDDYAFACGGDGTHGSPVKEWP